MFCMYKMVVITTEAYRDAKVHTIKVGNRKLFWLKMRDVQGLKNIPDLVRKEMQSTFESKNFTEEQKREYIRTEREISKIPTDNAQIKYARSDLMKEIIKNCRVVKKCNDSINRLEKEKQREHFRILLGFYSFKENDIYQRKEYSTVLKINKVFPNEIIRDQYKASKYYIDLFFPLHKQGIEIDENAHMDRSETEERERQKIIKKETNFKFIRINPDKENL